MASVAASVAAAGPKVLVAGKAAGTVLRSQMPINFLGTVDSQTGVINDPHHDLHGKSIRDVILVFPSGAGSSVGAYTIYAIKSGSVAPRAMICQRPDLTVATGCAVAGIPLIIVDKNQSVESDSILKSLQTGAQAAVDTSMPRGSIITIRGDCSSHDAAKA